MLHNEDRELQIRLAELQADVNIYLTVGLACFAAFMAISIGLQQVFFNLPPEEVTYRNLALGCMLLAGITNVIFTTSFMKKALATRKQMAELKKRYVW